MVGGRDHLGLRRAPSPAPGGLAQPSSSRSQPPPSPRWVALPGGGWAAERRLAATRCRRLCLAPRSRFGARQLHFPGCWSLPRAHFAPVSLRPMRPSPCMKTGCIGTDHEYVRYGVGTSYINGQACNQSCIMISYRYESDLWLIPCHPGLLGSKIRAMPPGVDGLKRLETVVTDDRVRYRDDIIAS